MYTTLPIFKNFIIRQKHTVYFCSKHSKKAMTTYSASYPHSTAKDFQQHIIADY